MIIVLGQARVRPDKLDEALALSQAHVRRSLEEPGCLEHGVSQDPAEPNRLVFVERWASPEALRTHFAVPASRSFAKALAGLVSETPSLAVYQATPVPTSALA